MDWIGLGQQKWTHVQLLDSQSESEREKMIGQLLRIKRRSAAATPAHRSPDLSVTLRVVVRSTRIRVCACVWVRRTTTRDVTERSRDLCAGVAGAGHR